MINVSLKSECSCVYYEGTHAYDGWVSVEWAVELEPIKANPDNVAAKEVDLNVILKRVEGYYTIEDCEEEIPFVYDYLEADFEVKKILDFKEIRIDSMRFSLEEIEIDSDKKLITAFI